MRSEPGDLKFTRRTKRTVQKHLVRKAFGNTVELIGRVRVAKAGHCVKTAFHSPTIRLLIGISRRRQFVIASHKAAPEIAGRESFGTGNRLTLQIASLQEIVLN